MPIESESALQGHDTERFSSAQRALGEMGRGEPTFSNPEHRKSDDCEVTICDVRLHNASQSGQCHACVIKPSTSGPATSAHHLPVPNLLNSQGFAAASFFKAEHALLTGIKSQMVQTSRNMERARTDHTILRGRGTMSEKS